MSQKNFKATAYNKPMLCLELPFFMRAGIVMIFSRCLTLQYERNKSIAAQHIDSATLRMANSDVSGNILTSSSK